MTPELAANAMTACEVLLLPLPPPVPLLTPPQPQTKVKTKTKKTCSTSDEVLDRTMAHSHPGVMAEMWIQQLGLCHSGCVLIRN